MQVYCCCGKLGDEGNGEKRRGRKGVGRVDRTVVKKKGLIFYSSLALLVATAVILVP